MKTNILVIAGHDPSGGAGIHADIEAIRALGGFASTLITGLTVQNSQNVRGFRLTDVDLLRQQAATLLEDYDYQAVKIGMTGSVAIIDFIAELLQQLPGRRQSGQRIPGRRHAGKTGAPLRCDDPEPARSPGSQRSGHRRRLRRRAG